MAAGCHTRPVPGAWDTSSTLQLVESMQETEQVTIDPGSRDSVLVPIRQMLDSLQGEALPGGSGGVVLVEGTAGTGKTFVLEAAATEAQRRGFRTLRISADTVAATSPLLGPAVTSRAKPRVILADNAHQISPDVLAELIRSLTLKTSGPVALLLTLRDAKDRAHLDRLLDAVHPRPVRMILRPLDPAAVVRMCTDLFGAPPAPDLLGWILTAGGNPRLTRALVDGLHEEDRVRVEGGLTRLAPGHDRPNRTLPQSVQGVVRTLLASLTTECRQLLYTAAVLGPYPDPELLAQMLGQSTAALLPVWEEAMHSDVLVRDGGGLVFAHELLRHAVAEALPVALRRALEGQRDRLAAAPPDATAAAPHVPAAPAAPAGPAQGAPRAGEPRVALAPAERPIGRITPREQAVLALLSRGRSNQQIARALGISGHAVKRHVSNLLIKLDCANRTEVALLAIKHQWSGSPDAVA